MQTLKKFLNNDLGVAAIIFAFSIPMIIGSAGVGVDVAKAYHTKNKLEKTLDAASLAGASTNLEGEQLKTFIKDYVKSNFRETDQSEIDLTNLDIQHDKANKTIVIEGEAISHTSFMSFFNKDSVTVAARSVAKEKLTGVEVALVLDNSESMSLGGRIGDLKDAANDFVDTLYDSSDTYGGEFKVGIVPYGTFVNVGRYGIGETPSGDKYGDGEGFVNNPDDLEYTKSRSKNNPGWSGCVFEHELYEDGVHKPKWDMYKRCHDTDGNRIDDGGSCSLTKRKMVQRGKKWSCKVVGKKTCSRNVDGVKQYYECDKKECKVTCLNAQCKHVWKEVPRKSKINIHNHCIKTTIQPLVLNTDSGSKGAIQSSISQLNGEKHQKTQSEVGMAWGYHLLSPEKPFTEAADWGSSKWAKALVFMTDGKVQADYYGPYYGISGSTGTKTNKSKDRFEDMCDKAKAKGIIVYTVQFGNIGDKDLLEACATDSQKSFEASNGADLQDAFIAIAEDLGNIYLAE